MILVDQSNLLISQLVVFTCASLWWELRWAVFQSNGLVWDAPRLKCRREAAAVRGGVKSRRTVLTSCSGTVTNRSKADIACADEHDIISVILLLYENKYNDQNTTYLIACERRFSIHFYCNTNIYFSFFLIWQQSHISHRDRTVMMFGYIHA